MLPIVYSLLTTHLFNSGNRSQSIDDGMKKVEKYDGLDDDQLKRVSEGFIEPNRVRGLINPFDKSQFIFKLTSNRRRWSHTFSESKIVLF